MQEKLPKRKKNRLENYDYSTCGAYFLTICTKDNRNYFWDNVNATIDQCKMTAGQSRSTNELPTVIPSSAEITTDQSRGDHWSSEKKTADQSRSTNEEDYESVSDFFQSVKLSQYGKIVDEGISNISTVYSSVSVDHYVIMPDHIHMLLFVRADEYGRPMAAPTVSRVVQQLKGYVTKRIGFSVWQKLFFDHVIRDRRDYEKHIKYIYENPIRRYYNELHRETNI